MGARNRSLPVWILALTACGSTPTPSREACNSPGVWRCDGNRHQFCTAGYWDTAVTCVAPQVCRLDNTGGRVGYSGFDGCYDPDAYCPYDGFASCNMTTSPSFELWTCSRRASDRTLQWTTERCDQLPSPAICEPDINFPYLPERPRCWEVVGTCPLPPTYPYEYEYCEGNTLLGCFGPFDRDGKVFFDLQTTDCALMGQVCRAGRCVRP
jgi:hypothetical protein